MKPQDLSSTIREALRAYRRTCRAKMAYAEENGSHDLGLWKIRLEKVELALRSPPAEFPARGGKLTKLREEIEAALDGDEDRFDGFGYAEILEHLLDFIDTEQEDTPAALQPAPGADAVGAEDKTTAEGGATTPARAERQETLAPADA